VPSSAITSHYYVLCHIHRDRLASDAFLSNKVLSVLITHRFLLSSLTIDSISSLPTALTFLLHCDQVTVLPPATSHRGHCKPKAVFNTFVYQPFKHYNESPLYRVIQEKGQYLGM